MSVRPLLLGLAIVVLALPACSGDGQLSVLGYSTKPLHDTQIRTVRVPIFENRTFRQGLEFDLTKEVCRQIEQKTPYKVVPKGQDADTELTGTITFANKFILNRNQLNEVREAETQIVVELVWRDLNTGEILSKPRPKDDDPLRHTPGVQTLQSQGVPGAAGAIVDQPPPNIDDNKCVVRAQSLANFIPELGGSITTGYQRNVQRLATQIVSMMEVPW